MIKKFKDTHKDSKEVDRFSNDEIDIITFQYVYGKSSLFLKRKRDDYFHECTGGMGFACGHKKKYNGSNVLSDSDYDGDFKLFTEGKIGMYSTSGSNFFFLKKISSDDIGELEYMSLPGIDKIEYLYEIEKDKYVLVTGRKFLSSYDTCRLFIITDFEPKELKIKNFERYRDGGTTEIKTEAGELYSPTPWNTDKDATWNDKPIKKVEKMPTYLKSTLERMNVKYDEFMENRKIIFGDGIYKQVVDNSKPFRKMSIKEIKDNINEIIKNGK